MLENDLVLTRFLDARVASLTDGDLAQLDCLLDLPDNELWDLISGRTEPLESSLLPLLQELRST